MFAGCRYLGHVNGGKSKFLKHLTLNAKSNGCNNRLRKKTDVRYSSQLHSIRRNCRSIELTGRLSKERERRNSTVPTNNICHEDDDDNYPKERDDTHKNTTEGM